jgi:hypothetical protein
MQQYSITSRLFSVTSHGVKYEIRKCLAVAAVSATIYTYRNIYHSVNNISVCESLGNDQKHMA